MSSAVCWACLCHWLQDFLARTLLFKCHCGYATFKSILLSAQRRNRVLGAREQQSLLFLPSSCTLWKLAACFPDSRWKLLVCADFQELGSSSVSFKKKKSSPWGSSVMGKNNEGEEAGMRVVFSSEKLKVCVPTMQFCLTE